jgi:hypothetical protein
MTSRPAEMHNLDIENTLSLAPDECGIYTLFDSNYNAVYFGKAEKQTLRQRLLQHIQSCDECLKSACFFSVEVVKNPGKVVMKKLKAYEAAHGRMPECHEKLLNNAANIARMLAIDGVLTTAFLN